jgi:hypothetical protein
MEDFASDILYILKNCTSAEIKEIIEIEIENACTSFKKAIYKRIISFKVGNEWWFEGTNHNAKTTRELVAIWKLTINLKKQTIYNNISVADYSHERLQEVEQSLKNCEITEQTYIEKCNHIMRCKEKEEALMNCCSCTVIGSNLLHESDENILRIICLPCDWDANSACLKF